LFLGRAQKERKWRGAEKAKKKVKNKKQFKMRYIHYGSCPSGQVAAHQRLTAIGHLLQCMALQQDRPGIYFAKYKPINDHKRAKAYPLSL
jgi:hypothetical protein